VFRGQAFGFGSALLFGLGFGWGGVAALWFMLILLTDIGVWAWLLVVVYLVVGAINTCQIALALKCQQIFRILDSGCLWSGMLGPASGSWMSGMGKMVLFRWWFSHMRLNAL